MCRFLCLLFIGVLSINLVNSWDIALTHGDQIEFFSNSTKVSNAGVRFKELTALAYDAVHNMLIFVDKSHDNASIFSYNLDNKKFQPLVRRKSLTENIQGLAFDPVTSKLFWTDHDEKSIFWISLIPGVNTDAFGNLLFKMDDELPRGIAVDSCRGYIYWTNVNFTKATIERARLDGTERKTIVSKDLFNPVSISIDQRSRKLYWADDKPGIHYTIESSDLDGNNRQLVLKGTPHEPNMITISKDSIYWVNDWSYNRVYKFSKNGEDSEPVLYYTFQDNQRSFGIVANYGIKDQTADVAECKALAKMALNTTAVREPLVTISRKETLFCLHGEPTNSVQVPCRCSLGYTGKYCDVNVCQNYCINGDCAPGIDGQPICSCNTGFTGTRCEKDTCRNYCLNGGSCLVQPENGTLSCQCKNEFEGERCEVKKVEEAVTPVTVLATSSEETCSCDSWDSVRDPIMMVLGILCGLLCVACAVLVTKVLHLRRRPRIKKRIIVNKNVTPLTARPDQCEITIENCCNMNICETPCFEPRATIRPTLLDAKPGKEEKRNLIANMENSDDLF